MNDNVVQLGYIDKKSVKHTDISSQELQILKCFYIFNSNKFLLSWLY